jgi:hypothetical protein
MLFITVKFLSKETKPVSLQALLLVFCWVLPKQLTFILDKVFIIFLYLQTVKNMRLYLRK